MGGKGGGGRVVVLNQYRGYRECRIPPYSAGYRFLLLSAVREVPQESVFTANDDCGHKSRYSARVSLCSTQTPVRENGQTPSLTPRDLPPNPSEGNWADTFANVTGFACSTRGVINIRSK